MLAAIKSHSDVVQYLLRNGAQVMAVDSFGQDALYHACQNDGNARVIRILLGHGSPVDRIVDGWTPLIAALSPAYEDNITAVLEGHPDVNYVTPDSETPLSFAIVNGTASIVKKVIEAGANVNWIDAHDTTPLIHAVSERDLDKVRLLLDAGADPSHRDVYALSEAAKSGDLQMITLIAAHCDAGQIQAVANKAAIDGHTDAHACLLTLATKKNR
jgi:ankyrin repeat protein